MMCQEMGGRGAGAVDRDGRERLAMTGLRGQEADGAGVRARGAQPGEEVVLGLELVPEGEAGHS